MILILLSVIILMSKVQQFMKELDAEDAGELNKYTGCKIDRKAHHLKLTQSVLI